MDNLMELLTGKYAEIRQRTLSALDQLDDHQVNWSPNEASNSIANLLIHIEGNIRERIGQGINGQAYIRNRDAEFEQLVVSKAELIERTERAFDELIETAGRMTEQTLRQTQWVRGRERTHLDVLLQCATHFSEHMGQILYIAKMLLDGQYVTTTVPKKKAT
ncbi:MAG: hypothetical protein K0Q59_1231 [Paenibacillus sp.]|jgi:uncharacterized damage-inducible protein DinB|nr:hypothetical protein [Paenibacillus sp.]